MTKDEVLKLALEALEEAWYHVGTFQPTEKAIDLYDEARTAIKEALAQPEQEPVAFVKGCNRGQWEIFPAKAYQIFEREQPLYTTPPPVAEPHKRKPLTDEEIYDMYNEPRSDAEMIAFARAIEAAHGIKGEA